jgi:hypothetical protein
LSFHEIAKKEKGRWIRKFWFDQVVDKGKGNNITIGDPRTPNPSWEVDTQKAPDKKGAVRTTNKVGGLRGKHDWIPDHVACPSCTKWFRR